MKASFLGLGLLILAKLALGQAGDLDTTFGSDGIVTIFSDENGYGQDIAIQSDGKIVVGGEISADCFVVVRFNIDGSPDSTFGINGIAQTIVGIGYNQSEKIALQADGKIVVGGICANFQGYFAGALARFNSDGTLDNTFGIEGKVIYAFNDPQQYANSAYALAITADQKIVTAGRAGINTNSIGFAVARFNPNGSLDNTFGTNGIVITSVGNPFSSVKSIAIQNDGKIVLGGDSYSTTNCSFAIARLNTDGSLDQSFSGDGKDTLFFYNTVIYHGGSVGKDIFIQPDGKILIAGESGSSKNDILYAAIARYNTDGSLDLSFGTGGKKLVATTGYKETHVYTTTLQSDGKIIIGGGCSDPDFPNQQLYTMMIMRLMQSGDLDGNFGDNGIVTLAVPFEVGIISAAMDQQQRIVSAGVSDSGITVLRILSGLNVGIVNLDHAENHPLLIYPNPIATTATLEYTLAKNELIAVALYTLQGVLVMTFKTEFQQEGSHCEPLQFESSLPSGNYILSIAGETGHQDIKIALIK